MRKVPEVPEDSILASGSWDYLYGISRGNLGRVRKSLSDIKLKRSSGNEEISFSDIMSKVCTYLFYFLFP